MSQSTPPATNLPAHDASGRGASGLLCPACKGDIFTEKTSFKTSSEPILGAAEADVIIDLMSCRRCGADIPAVRGRKRYAILTEKKLSSLVADFEEARRINIEMQGLVEMMDRRFSALSAEIETCRAEGELSVLETQVAALEAETASMEKRRARLAEILEMVASATMIPAA